MIVLHLSEKWINPFYSEDDFLELISLLTLKKYLIVLTTDNSTKKKFIKVYDKYKIISNKELEKLKSIDNNILILDNLDYDSWTKIIYSSYTVITPECGCSHISAACKVPVNIIYDSNNHPEAIHKEFPNKLLAYNCSPSFNWKKNLDRETMKRFQSELGKMGYKFQFITLAGFHLNNYATFKLAQDYKKDGMAAYSELQEAEFAAE